MNAFELKHPLVEHKLSILRNEKTGTKEFRELIKELSVFLCYEAMRDVIKYVQEQEEKIKSGEIKVPQNKEEYEAMKK